MSPFSILERIDVGETGWAQDARPGWRCLSVSSNGSTWVKHVTSGGQPLTFRAFSILERIDVGETSCAATRTAIAKSFSILERIDVGETLERMLRASSDATFQYPRTDRRG